MTLAERSQGAWPAPGLTGALMGGLTGVVLAAIAFFRTRHLDEAAAAFGLSPEQVALVANRPELFANGFPSHASENLKSIIYHVYPLAQAAGIDVSLAWAFMIVLEIMVFAAAAVWAVRRLFPGAPWALAGIAAILFTASSLTTPDLARFQFPYYGWMYAFAYAGVIVVITETVRNNFLMAALVLVATFMTHPISGLFAGAFVAAVLIAKLATGERVNLIALAAASIVTIVGGGTWLAWLSGQGTITGGDVDPETYVAYVRALNYHWFPSFLGVYWELHAQHLIPLLSTLALLGWAISAQPLSRLQAASGAPSGVVAQLAAGILAMLAICAAGLVIAEFVAWPLLLKMSLHRADTVAMLAGGFLIARALYRDVTEGDLVEQGLGTILILLLLIADYGLAPLPVGLRIGYAAYKARRDGGWSAPLVMAALLIAVLAVLALFYAAVGQLNLRALPYYIGVYPAWQMGIVVAVAVLFIRWARAGSLPNRSLRMTIIMAIIAGTALARAPKFQHFQSDAGLARAESALDAQLWARNHTAEGTLFMIAPALNYMWRDKSHRPSFGTPREWLLLSIMYNSRKDLFEEGLSRYRALGLPNPDYVFDPAITRMFPLIDRIVGEAEDRYHALALEDFVRLAQTYGIAFFVFQKGKLDGDPPLETVYQNDHFVIASAP